jgi:hypothetical protein
MRIKSVAKQSISIVAGLLIAGSASAIPALGDIAIDFRTSDWAAGHGQNAYTFDGTTVTAAQPAGALLYRDNKDGFGIQGGEFDEIDGDERLSVSFDGSRLITGVWITDLFGSPDGQGSYMGEIGFVDLYFGNATSANQTKIFFGTDSDQNNGEQYVKFDNPFAISWVQFEAINVRGHEFSVAGFSVPEPASIALFGLGLLGLGICRRKSRT